MLLYFSVHTRQLSPDYVTVRMEVGNLEAIPESEQPIKIQGTVNSSRRFTPYLLSQIHLCICLL